MEELKRQTRALDDDVKQLTEEVHRLNARQDRTDKVWRWLVASLLLILALVGMIGAVAVNSWKTAQQQEQLRADVLCPLYGIFLGAYDPASRDKNPDPKAREKYEDAYNKIRQGWQVMKCTDPIVPPKTN